jgi:hypothetical protein
MLEQADLDAIRTVFNFYEMREEGDRIVLYGEPLVDPNVL